MWHLTGKFWWLRGNHRTVSKFRLADCRRGPDSTNVEVTPMAEPVTVHTAPRGAANAGIWSTCSVA
jgi:hypothetical protein